MGLGQKDMCIIDYEDRLKRLENLVEAMQKTLNHIGTDVYTLKANSTSSTC